MIEAVNSVISNAPILRGNADQVATTQSFAADAAAVQSVARAPLAPYISPYISMDANFNKAVLQLRDSETGDVVTQFPSEQTLRARQKQDAAALNTQLAGARSEPISLSGDGAKSASSAIGGSVPAGITIVQESTPAPQPAPSLGSGIAQAAIAALSLGASIGQLTSTVSVTA